MQTMYHIGWTPAGVYIHRLDPVKVHARAQELRAGDTALSEDQAIAEAHEEYVDAIRATIGFPPRGRWFNRDGWQSTLTVGEPHQSLLDRCLNRDTDGNPDVDTLPNLPDAPQWTPQVV